MTYDLDNDMEFESPFLRLYSILCSFATTIFNLINSVLSVLELVQAYLIGFLNHPTKNDLIQKLTHVNSVHIENFFCQHD